MNDDIPEANDKTGRGARPALIEDFAIVGLYGYRTISLSSRYAATILIAKNGSGKTTLIGALDAFLKGQFTRLRDLNFSEIKCRLRGIEGELSITHDDIVEFLDVPIDSEIARYARRIEVEPSALFRFVTEDYSTLRDDYRALNDDSIYAAIHRTSGYRRAEVAAVCERLAASVAGKNARIEAIRSAIGTVLKGIEIVYLPTYRRIELPLIPDAKEYKHSGRKASPFKFSAGSLFTGDIQFGLSDISEHLSALNQTILIDSNHGYRQISANIINELIDGAFENAYIEENAIPTKDELELFFSRLKEGGRMGPYLDDVSVPNIDKIYTGNDIPADSSKFLRYFLSKLNTVIMATRDIEVRVEEFIQSCNKYLSSKELSTSLPPGGSSEARRQPSQDDKVLRLNRRNLNVHAESLIGGRKIPLDALSSGEKQMVSLFAKLFLYPNDKIFLIDEPELSLSMDWQREILVDVINAPRCQQVIAITHSPFVFDNDLEPFAKALQISVDLSALPPQADDAGGDSGE
ncbi:AAA family ATPase [Mesorhizobium sp. VK4C]|uniref:AAA family ATPase n=1 Tax=Mesorhizobium captivum TaxID=3072319 RepID=UPI002A23FA94|nr:AAA family ATPase [Mesorhizobium sp. VK4C]MDX8496898.1 AAA family ATPase [Mesorhizobium sp. VK4C]